MRTYTFIAMRHGGHFEFWPPRVVTSQVRIRTVAAILFRKWFGGRCPDRPNRCWGKDGFMAEFADRRGNVLLVEQTNYRKINHRAVDPFFRTPGPSWLPKYSDKTALMVIEKEACRAA